jgi:serine/threonine protein kinase
VVGTDGYIAPESYLGLACPKSDVFSAGVLMYTLITRRFPYHNHLFDDGPDENYVGSPKMREIHDKVQECKVRFGRSWKDLDEAKDFCMALMEFDVRKRPNAEEALKHPWMAKFDGKAKAAEIVVNTSTKSTKKENGYLHKRAVVTNHTALPAL